MRNRWQRPAGTMPAGRMVVASLLCALGATACAVGEPGDGRLARAQAAVGPAAVVGFWQFDDCNPQSAVLVDSSGFGNTANRTATAACVPGIAGQAVDFTKNKDAVTVADSPSFAFGNQVAVAAWVNPTTTAGTQTIIDQQFGGSTTFALTVKNGNFVFSVTLASGKVAKSTAPLPAGVWSHVAGSYDGQFVFLYLDGQQVGQVDAPGTLAEADGPLEIGNNAAKQQFNGALDNVWISTAPVTVADIAALACISQAPTLVATPSAGPAVPAGTPVDYSLVLTDNDVGFCQPAEFFFEPEFSPELTVLAQFQEVELAPGASTTFPMTVVSSPETQPGVYPVPFFVEELFPGSAFLSGQVTYDVAQPTGCFVDIQSELMITDLSVVEDPVRTTWTGAPGDPRTGAWTFGNLMQNLAPTPAQAPAMVEQLLDTWLTDQTVNGFTVAARPAIQQQVIDPWPRSPDGTLDLTRAPLRLDAIVNRMDVRNLDQGTAGEGRFVFGVMDQNGFPLQFTLIVEYALPATTEADVLAWGNAWQGLGQNPFPSEAYNVALQALTDRFAGRNATPANPNGSALAQVRTNEIALSFFEWELREFHLAPDGSALQESTVALTPDLSLDQTPTLADFVNQNAAAIDTQIFTVPASFEGQPFLGGSSLNPLPEWSAPGIVDNQARHFLALNTCNGCHGPETGTNFLHIAPRFQGQPSQLSGFLTGITVFDPVTGAPSTLNDLAARQSDLTQLVCTPPLPQKAPASAKAARSAFVRRGPRQVH